MLKRLLAVVAYALLFLLSTLLFTYFLLPLEPLREYAESMVNNSPRFRLEIGELTREGMGTVTLNEVTLGINRKLLSLKARKPAAAVPVEKEEPAEGASASPTKGDGTVLPEGEEDGGGEEFSFVDIQSLTVRIDLWDLLEPESISLNIDANLLGGVLEKGRVDLIQHEGKTLIGLELPVLEGLDFGQTEFFGAIFSSLLPSVKTDRVEGQLADGVISWQPVLDGDLPYYAGHIDVELTDIVALSPMLVQRIKGASEAVEVPLTDMKLGKCSFKLRVDVKERMTEMDKVKAKESGATVILLERGECKGESLDYYIRPDSYLIVPPKGSMARGKMDLWTKLAFNPDYFDEERRGEDNRPLTRNRELGQGLEFDRSWQNAQDADGFYWMHCTGTMATPRCQRGLPAEEKRRKKGLEEQQRKAKEEEGRKRREAEKPAAGESGDAAVVRAEGGERGESAAQRRAEARKRAEEVRKQRMAGRMEQEAAAEAEPPPQETPPQETPPIFAPGAEPLLPGGVGGREGWAEEEPPVDELPPGSGDGEGPAVGEEEAPAGEWEAPSGEWGAPAEGTGDGPEGELPSEGSGEAPLEGTEAPAGENGEPEPGEENEQPPAFP